MVRWFSYFLPLLSILMIPLSFWLRKRYKRRQQLQRQERNIPHCLRCGYDLRGLGLPRCPECGALRGFRESMEELGLTREEVAQIQQKWAAAVPPPPPQKQLEDQQTGLE